MRPSNFFFCFLFLLLVSCAPAAMTSSRVVYVSLPPNSPDCSLVFLENDSEAQKMGYVRVAQIMFNQESTIIARGSVDASGKKTKASFAREACLLGGEAIGPLKTSKTDFVESESVFTKAFVYIKKKP